MLGYILCALGGFLFGVVITCILLAKKNLETYKQISISTENSFKKNIEAAKGAYKAYSKEIDKMYSDTPDDDDPDESLEENGEEVEEETDDNEEVDF